MNLGEFEASLCLVVLRLKETKGTHYAKGRLKELLAHHPIHRKSCTSESSKGCVATSCDTC